MSERQIPLCLASKVDDLVKLHAKLKNRSSVVADPSTIVLSKNRTRMSKNTNAHVIFYRPSIPL